MNISKTSFPIGAKKVFLAQHIFGMVVLGLNKMKMPAWRTSHESIRERIPIL